MPTTLTGMIVLAFLMCLASTGGLAFGVSVALVADWWKRRVRRSVKVQYTAEQGYGALGL